MLRNSRISYVLNYYFGLAVKVESCFKRLSIKKNIFHRQILSPPKFHLQSFIAKFFHRHQVCGCGGHGFGGHRCGGHGFGWFGFSLRVGWWMFW